MVKKIAKISGIILLAAVIVLQFIRPAKNISSDTSNSIETMFPVPDSVRAILTAACFDCHSNNTRYPWYAEIQPVGWFLNDHITDGKRELNFSEFASYQPRRQYRKLAEVRNMIDQGFMPLESYTLLHKDAVLSPHQKEMMYAWVRTVRDSIEAWTPADSLKMPNRRR